MKQCNRRDFLKDMAITGALAAAGCSGAAAGGALPLPKPKVALPADPAGAPALSIARFGGPAPAAEETKRMAVKLVETALENLGGMKRFVPKGGTVWIKPNINFHMTPEFASNTTPDIVGAVVRLAREAGAAKVCVGDHSAFGSKVSYPMSGIEEAAKAAGAEVVYLDEKTFQDYAIGGQILDKWRLCPQILEADLIVNVPVGKNHPLPKFSGCLKNLMGVAGGDRSKWHENLAECLADLNLFLKPRLHILDMVRSITAGPPRGGNLADVKFFGVVAAGIDPVAVDALGAELLGHPVDEIAVIAKAAARGVGQSDYRKLPMKDVTV